MKPINITPIIKKYGPGFVAKHKKTGKIVAYDKEVDVLFKRVSKRDDVVISWIPEPGKRYF